MFAIRLANALSESHKVFFIELYPERTTVKRQLSLLNKQKTTIFQPGISSKTRGWASKILNKPAIRKNKIKTPATVLVSEVLSFIKKNKITIVNSHSWDSDVYFAHLKNKLNFTLVSSFHGHYDFVADKREHFTSRTTEALENIDSVVYTSPKHIATLDAYHYPVAKRHKIFYGLPVTATDTITTFRAGEPLQIVMVARGIKEKGWEQAIQAALQVAKEHPGQIKLNLVGEGVYLEELKGKYTHPAIAFTGYREDVKEIVTAAHIGILPTTYIAESLPNTIIEYLCCGKPVIATNVGAIKEMISVNEEAAGSCIELENGKANVNYVAAAIENYMSHPDLVEKHSAIALQAAQQFSMKKCVEGYLNVFTDLQKEIKVNE